MLSPGFDERFSHGLGVAEETEAKAVAWPPSPERVLVVAAAKRLNGLVDPKAKELSEVVPNAMLPPRGTGSGWLGSFPRVADAAKV